MSLGRVLETHNVVCIVGAVWWDMHQQLGRIHYFMAGDEVFHLAECTQSPE